jgi:hypothetical protein
MIKKLLTVIFLLIAITEVKAQFRESIQTDRPGQSYNALTVGKNVFQFESGLFGSMYEEPGYENFLGNRDQKTGFVSSIRFGIAERVEVSTDFSLLRNEVTYRQTNKTSTAETTDLTNSLSAWRIGVRANILEQKGWRPDLAVGLVYHTPWVSDGFEYTDNLPELIITSNHSIAGKYSLNPTISVFYTSLYETPNLKGSLNFTIPVLTKGGIFLGAAGYNDIEDKWRGIAEAGFYYQATPNLQFDFDFGFDDVLTSFRSVYGNLGVSFRIYNKEEK